MLQQVKPALLACSRVVESVRLRHRKPPNFPGKHSKSVCTIEASCDPTQTHTSPHLTQVTSQWKEGGPCASLCPQTTSKTGNRVKCAAFSPQTFDSKRMCAEFILRSQTLCGGVTICRGLCVLGQATQTLSHFYSKELLRLHMLGLWKCISVFPVFLFCWLFIKVRIVNQTPPPRVQIPEAEMQGSSQKCHWWLRINE